MPVLYPSNLEMQVSTRLNPYRKAHAINEAHVRAQ
ncbi:hypothetical protein XM78_c21044 [Vibrio vulnificus]|nr:hypothetical protein XM78_c21044 [Vibrio vulnificus]